MQVLYIIFQGIKADLKQFSFLCTLIEHRNGIKCLKLKWNHELQVGGSHSQLKWNGWETLCYMILLPFLDLTMHNIQ